MQSFRSIAIFLLAGLTVVGCGGSDKPTEPAKVLTTLVVSIPSSTIQVGQTVTGTVSGKDENGADFVVSSVTWSSSASNVATVGLSGVITAVAAGTTSIVASSGNVSGQQTLTVTPVPIASVSLNTNTATLTIGGTLQLTATARDLFSNELTGRAITWGTSDASKVTVSSTGFVTAVAGGSATITATCEGKSASATITVFTPGTPVVIANVGGAQTFLASPNFNVALTMQQGSKYLVAVVNTDQNATVSADFSLSTVFSPGAAIQSVASANETAPKSAGNSFTQIGLPAYLQPSVPFSKQRQAERARVHLQMLQQDFERGKTIGNVMALNAKARALRSQSVNSQPAQLSVSNVVGSVNKMYVRKLTSNFCSGVDSVNARTVAVGQKLIVLADTNRALWPDNARPDSSFYQSIADEYDQLTYPLVVSIAGDPLALDATLSSVGKMTMLITPLLNNIASGSGTVTTDAFTNTCDMVATPGSNLTEVMYFRVPISGEPVAYWQAAVRPILAHESKHVSSFAAHIANNNGFTDQLFLEEGIAQLSDEIWGRNFSNATWKGHATFQQSLACEFTFNFSTLRQCPTGVNQVDVLYGSEMFGFFQYLRGQDGGAQGLSLPTFEASYGAGWAFARWATDQFAGTTEATFIKRMVNEPRLTGLNSIAGITGQSVQQLLVSWAVASAIFGPVPTPADVKNSIPSFDFADIFSVGQTSFGSGGTPIGIFTIDGSRNPIYPVIPITLPTGNFTRAVTGVRGTASAYFLISGTSAGIENLQLLSVAGGTISAASNFRVALFRVQ